MLFIPVGLDKSEVRRIPWVSFALIGVNILVFLSLWMSSLQSPVREELSQKSEAVAQYLGQRPYLKVPYELEQYLDAYSRHRLEEARAAASRTRPVDYVVRRQQQTLNDMVLDLFATVRRLPLLKWGYVPGEPQADRLLTCLFVHAGWVHLIGNMLFCSRQVRSSRTSTAGRCFSCFTFPPGWSPRWHTPGRTRAVSRR